MTTGEPLTMVAPAFDSLPLDPLGPPGNAWGRFGEKDQLGMLNLLTPTVVAEAAKEIRNGVRVSLDWPLNKPIAPSYGRDPLQHRLIHKGTPEIPMAVNDDVLTFNTQGSSQWDGKVSTLSHQTYPLTARIAGFRHFAYQPTAQYYHGLTHAEMHAGGTQLGIDVFAEAGGIVGRGVLLDYAAWADEHSTPLTPFEPHGIKLGQLLEVAAAQNVTFRPGDILFIRSGFTRAYDALSQEEQAALPNRPAPEFDGVESSESIIRWFWREQFAAVAGDAPAFEASPFSGPHCDPQFILHQWLLPQWGMPIGELFDLERLSQECRQQNRYSFFLSSVPLKVPGGVASPPNAVAIF